MQLLKYISLFTGVIALVQLSLTGVQAQTASPTIPNYWDSNIRLTRPDNLKLTRLRFLTTTDFPPFNFIDRNKRLSGLHVDIARHICSQLDILRLCQIQALPWDELDAAVEKREGDAVIAGLEKTAETEKRYDFSHAFLQIPARFTALQSANLHEPMSRALFQKKTGLVKNSSHARYFKAVFSNRKYVEFDTIEQARKALKDKTISTIFSDAVSQSFWLASTGADNCCRFAGGPYLSREYFGNGLTIAVAKGNPELVEAINFALMRINSNGTFRELYLRYFPIGLY